jgi:hypothetical protein
MNPAWTTWAKNAIRVLKDGANLIYPLGGKGVVFRVDKVKHELVTLCEHPEYYNSPVDRMNRSVFDAIGYTVIRHANTPTNIESTIKALLTRDGMKLIDADLIEGLGKIFSMKPSAIEKMLHQASGGKQPINPITYRGEDGLGNPRCLAMGRLWLSFQGASDGQHKFGSGIVGGHVTLNDVDKVMQFLIFEGMETPKIFGFMVANEENFVSGIKAILTGQKTHFILSGTITRQVLTTREITFTKMKQGDRDVLLANMYDSTVDGKVLSTVQVDYQHFDKGLEHLFVKGELISTEAN